MSGKLMKPLCSTGQKLASVTAPRSTKIEIVRRRLVRSIKTRIFAEFEAEFNEKNGTEWTLNPRMKTDFTEANKGNREAGAGWKMEARRFYRRDAEKRRDARKDGERRE